MITRKTAAAVRSYRARAVSAQAVTEWGATTHKEFRSAMHQTHRPPCPPPVFLRPLRALSAVLVAALSVAAAARADLGDVDVPEVDEGWSVVFEDSMMGSAWRSGWMNDHWAAVRGDWQATPAGLRHRGGEEDGLLLLRWPLLRGAWRVEYEAMSEAPGDLSVVVGCPARVRDVSPYPAFLFASSGNTQSKLLVPGKPTLVSERLRAEPGIWHRIALERSGGRLVAEVDGERVMEGVDTPEGLEAPYLALYTWLPGTFRAFRVLTRPDAALEDFLTPGALARERAFPTNRLAAMEVPVPRILPAEMVTMLYVATNGNNRWSGACAEPTADGRDGPLASPQAALDRVAGFATADGGLTGPIDIQVQAGVYPLEQPLRIGAAQSGRPGNRNPKEGVFTPPLPVTLRGAGGGATVLTGGRRITGLTETVVHNRRAWVAELPAVREGAWVFSQLWVNGERRERPFLPREGWYRVASPVGGEWPAEWEWHAPHSQFVYRPGDLNPYWTNLTDIAIHLFNYWADNRLQLRALDGPAHIAQLDRQGVASLRGDDRVVGGIGARYRVENVYEALTEPGEWYLDRQAGRLTYLPLPGESVESAEVVAPVLSELVRIEGDATNALVREVWLEGFTLAHAEWAAPTNWPGSNQAANEVPGAVVVRHARDVGLRGCRIEHVGSYGVELAEDCWQVTLAGNRIQDLGGGGIKIWHGCNRNIVTDNTIAHGGLIFEQAVGLLIGRSGANRVLHNDIHHFGYSGISIGWHWGYEEGGAAGNIVEYNHIHDIGRGTLSDMGGIYTLSPQPGTRLRYNRIHDVRNHTYGGWGIYFDEGSSFILAENNLAYRCGTGGFNQHYGEGNEVRNNIFALSATNALDRGRNEPHTSFIFERNIVLSERPTVWLGIWSATETNAVVRQNLYWRLDAPDMTFDGLDFAGWQALGLDAGSVIADPKFRDPQAGDFDFRRGAPLDAIGFEPFDLSAVGPRAPWRD